MKFEKIEPFHSYDPKYLYRGYVIQRGSSTARGKFMWYVFDGDVIAARPTRKETAKELDRLIAAGKLKSK